MNRPYLSLSIHRLAALYVDHMHDMEIMHKLHHELSFRESKLAKELTKKLDHHIKSKKYTPKMSRPAIVKPPNRDASKNISDFKITDEQQNAVDLFSSRQSLKISAFAGTGKTSTLLAMAKNDTRTGLYLAFNRAIADEARRKFPNSVDCRTIHSLAFNGVKGAFSSPDKLVTAFNGHAVAALLKLKDLEFEGFRLPASFYGSLINRSLHRFCQNGLKRFARSHVVRTGRLAALSPDDQENLIQNVFREAKRLWERMIDPSDEAPLGHDGYLKLWALSEPVIPRDYILLDEAQDTNAVVLEVLRQQSAQLIYVGDAHQQIYEWRGAVNAMERIETAHQSYLTMSFRFGEAIAEAANQILRALEETRPIRGNPNQNSQLGADWYDVVLSRTNAMLMTELMRLLKDQKRVYIVGGIDDLKRLLEGVRMLQANKPTDVPEFFGYASWHEVLSDVKTDGGHELRTFVNLVETFSVGQLLKALQKTHKTESSADVVLSTAHKAKGRQWNRVYLTDDFLRDGAKSPNNGDLTMDPEEIRIAYVAVTRAKEAVYIPAGIRGAFEIEQDPKYDLDSSSDVTSQSSSDGASAGAQSPSSDITIPSASSA